jgi:hypothetical protein
MNSINPDVFLKAIFPSDVLAPDERIVVAYPDSFVSRETGETVDYYRQLNWRPGVVDDSKESPTAQRSWYYCVSAVAHQRARQVKKRLEDVRTAFVLVVDDVGTKSKLPPVEPSYALETSLGNYQWGYLIEPFDVSAHGAAYYDQCLVSLAAAGFNDPGFRSANRLARLPGSVHKSGFRARVVNWRPDRFWELPELMREFAVPMMSVRAPRERAPGVTTRLNEVQDPLYDWLYMYRGIRGSNHDWIYVNCPWRAGHTNGAQGPTSTGFSPYGYGRYMDRGFKCLHGHCQDKTIKDFEEWAQSQGAPIALPRLSLSVEAL